MATLRGLTWGHRRAIEPLRASAAAFKAETGIEVDWRVRSLEDFEHQSFAQAVKTTDLIVFDHPHLGDVVTGNLLLPLHPLLGDEVALGEATSFIGQSLVSYRANGDTWAVPVDGATIHAVFRPDLMQALDVEVPRRWADAIALMKRAKRRGYLALLSGQGHHLLLTLASIMANLGHRWLASGSGNGFELDRAALADALDRIDEALDAGDRERSLTLNAIGVHELLASEPSTIYCPAAYGYAVYGLHRQWPFRLAFGPFPGPGPVPHVGTMIGGAGVGITHACADLVSASRYLIHLWRDETQRRIFARASGQPARIESWNDSEVDAMFNGFFTDTFATVATASIRPRFAGYSLIEQRLAATLQAHYAGHTTRIDCIDLMSTQAAGAQQ